jgi:hypothetical protein
VVTSTQQGSGGVSSETNDPDRLRSRRRFAVGSAIGILAAMPVLAWFINLGSWNFLQNGFFTNFYDAQARALFHGHWYVPPRVVSIEGFAVKGHTYMYYGPFPALLRMPILLFTSSLDGRLTQLSMLLAVLVALVCSARLAWKIRNLVLSTSVSVKEAVLVACSIAVIGLGSVFVFLTTVAIVYHEAEAWGAALAIAAFDALIGFLIRPSTRGIVLTGLFATLDLLTRGSVGLGPVAAVGLLAVLHAAVSLWRRGAFRRPGAGTASAPPDEGPERTRRLAWIGLPDVTAAPTRTISLACAAGIPLALYASINYMKFGSLFSVPWTSQVQARYGSALRAGLAANGNSFLGLKFVPTALVQYLRPDALRTSRLFPFVAFPPPASVIGHVLYVGRTFASSVTTTMLVFVVAGVVGLWAVFHPVRRLRHGIGRAPGRLAVLRVPILGAAVGIVGSLEIAFTAQRYLADWMPLLILSGLAGLAVVVHRSRSMARWARRTVVGVGCVLAVVGVLANVSLSILYQRELNPWGPPISARAQFVGLQQGIDQHLFGNPPQGVTFAQHLPKLEPAGSLVILRNCASLYQSTGTTWQAVERSGAGGHYRLAVTFGAVRGAADVYWPLLVTGERGVGSYVAVRPVGPDEVRFAYLIQGPHSTWVKGQAVQVTPGRSYVVDIVLDTDDNDQAVTLNGTTVSSGIYVRAPEHVTFGVDTIRGPTAPAFVGKVERLATPTPTCDSLRRRLERADR